MCDNTRGKKKKRFLLVGNTISDRLTFILSSPAATGSQHVHRGYQQSMDVVDIVIDEHGGATCVYVVFTGRFGFCVKLSAFLLLNILHYANGK